MNKLDKFASIMISISALFIVMTSTAHGEIAVIGNPDLSVDSLDQSIVRQLFLGEVRTLSDGGATVFDQHERSRIKTEFYRKVLNKNRSEMRAHRAELLVSDKEMLPKLLHGDTEMIQQVSENRYAIGYVDARSVNKSVKVLFRLP